MSRNYRRAEDVPNEVLIARLEALSDAITNGDAGISREFDMRIPAEVDHDADIVLAEAARRLRKLTI